jgi:hypothetical protein
VGTDLYDTLHDGVIAVPTSRPHLGEKGGGDIITDHRRLHDPIDRHLPHLRTVASWLHGDDHVRQGMARRVDPADS